MLSGTNIFAELETFLEETPPLKYIPKLNINESGEQYSANDFDIDPSECGAKEIIAKKMSNQSGAGKYYSANNDVANLHRDEIPDANGYPFIQVEYTPDNTGRIKRSGLAGESFQIGSGKETKYFYSIPSQEELYRLFGSEVGDANKYTKQIIQNSDGQLNPIPHHKPPSSPPTSPTEYETHYHARSQFVAFAPNNALFLNASN